MSVTVHHGDNRDVLRSLPDNSIDSVVTDPPYALVSIQKRFGKPGSAPARGDVYARASAGFMGKQWDTGEVAFAAEFWAEILRVLKPGGHVVAFSGTRTYHRMAVAIEDAGFEIRDQLGWLYGSGFPKSHDVVKGIDAKLGARGGKVARGAPVRRIRPGADQHKDGSWEKLDGREYQPGEYVPGSQEAAAWQGYGTALKPAWEPICLARKPLDGTVAENVLRWGVGALNIDGCRIEGAKTPAPVGQFRGSDVDATGLTGVRDGSADSLGRWPANIAHDGSTEVVAAFPEAPGQQGVVKGTEPSSPFVNVYGDMPSRAGRADPRADSGSAARFFYTAKADREDRLGSKHPTVKPVDLMAWLVRLVTPPGGLVLDPFAGTGTTGSAAMREGMRCILIEREAEYVEDIHRRIAWVKGEGRLTAQETARKQEGVEALPLFGGAA